MTTIEHELNLELMCSCRMACKSFHEKTEEKILIGSREMDIYLYQVSCILFLKYTFTEYYVRNASAKPQVISQKVQGLHVFVSSTDIDFSLVQGTTALMIKTRKACG